MNTKVMRGQNHKKLRWMFALSLSALSVSLVATGGHAQTNQPMSDAPLILAAAVEQEQRPRRKPTTPAGEELDYTGWAFYVDNDGLAPGDTDRDYTGGFSLTLTGARTRSLLISADSWLGAIDRRLRIGDHGSATRLHSVEWGFTAFTPADVSIRAAQTDDRPYASLVYLSNSRQQVDQAANTATVSTLTLGVLGLELAANVQNDLHRSAGFRVAEGWDNQISDGGEPTARYGLSKQWLLAGDYSGAGFEYELQSAAKLNLGYLTDAGVSLSARFGRLRSPWWGLNPQLSEYAEKASPLSPGFSTADRNESYVWGGIGVRLRAYNAFLQGQFRETAVSLDSGELNHLLAEAWFGYTHEFAEGLRLSYVLRGQSAEIRSGPASRDVFWGGLIVSQTL